MCLKSVMTAGQFGVLYGFRWQIELLFKSFKSQLHVDLIKGKSKQRIDCYIIARLISITSITTVFSQLAEDVSVIYNRELSFDKFTSMILRKQILKILFSSEKSDYRMMQMNDKDILILCKQKRFRRTSRELLHEEASIWEKFLENPIEAQFQEVA